MATTVAPLAPRTAGRRIGDLFVELGFASREEVEQAARDARMAHEPTGRLLVERGLITPEQLARAVAARYEVPFVELESRRIDPAAVALIPPEVALRFLALPIARDGNRLRVAMANPGDVVAADDIGMLTGLEIERVGASPDAIEAFVTRVRRESYAGASPIEEIAGHTATEIDVRETPDQAPLVNLINSIVARAIEQRASDIHFDWDADEMHIRYRVDGMTRDVTTVPPRLAAGVISRIKIMSQLDIGERRVPQDGRISMHVGDDEIDVRVVTLPVIHGESAVLRILSRGEVPSIDGLGMSAHVRERFERALARPWGGVLATGPTGCGKTTTLYAGLALLNSRERTIVTIEDPVEYRLDGIKQVQVVEARGMTFARGLRSILRSDPDIVLVGEVRDQETAQIATEAALTGHVVLSTLHTNDAPTAITRLLEMGVEPFLVASSIVCIVGQRLARVLCERCKRPTGEGYEAVGCPHCHDTGYSGRVGLFEALPITPEISELVIARRSADEIAAKGVEQGMLTMADDGLEKVRAGITSVAEVTRVVLSAQAQA